MLKEIARRSYTEDGDPRIEIFYECEYGIIKSNPSCGGGGWSTVENLAYARALEKYSELLREDNKLFEV